MRKETRIIDNKNKIAQITLDHERWYYDYATNTNYPSVSWISSFYPKGIQFYKWLASKGWDESENIKNEAGERGTKVHEAISILLHGRELDFKDFQVQEWKALLSFKSWYEEFQPKILANEITGISKKYVFGGTIDLICQIGKQRYVVDFKTSKQIWKEYEIQLSAYGKMVKEMEQFKKGKYKLAILQVGYNLNKKGFKFTEIPDKFKIFQSVRQIWDDEVNDKEPTQISLPTQLKLTI